MYFTLLKYHRYRRNFLSSYEWYFSKFLVYRTISCYSEVFYTNRRWIYCIFKYALLNILIVQGRWNQITVVSRDNTESTSSKETSIFVSSIDYACKMKLYTCENYTCSIRVKRENFFWGKMIFYLLIKQTVNETKCLKHHILALHTNIIVIFMHMI